MAHDANAEILRKLVQIGNSDQEIQLINAYKGVPISNTAVLVRVGEKTVELQTHKYQIVCMSKYRETYIQSGWLPLTARAKVLKVDFLHNRAVVSEFEYLASTIGSRKLVRVVPKEPVDVFLQNDTLSGKIRTELVDLSLQGIGVHVMSELFRPRAFEAGREITASLSLPSEKEDEIRTMKVKGMIVHSEPAGWFRGYRIGIMLLPGSEAKTILSNYVRARQSEIFSEVKVQYDLMSRLAERDQDTP